MFSCKCRLIEYLFVSASLVIAAANSPNDPLWLSCANLFEGPMPFCFFFMLLFPNKNRQKTTFSRVAKNVVKNSYSWRKTSFAPALLSSSQKSHCRKHLKCLCRYIYYSAAKQTAPKTLNTAFNGIFFSLPSPLHRGKPSLPLCPDFCSHDAVFFFLPVADEAVRIRNNTHYVSSLASLKGTCF